MVYNILVLFMLAFMIFNQYIKQTKEIKILNIFISLLILGFISGVRYQNYHSDFSTNYHVFAITSSLGWKEIILSDYEVGIKLLMKALSVVSNNPQGYFIFTSLFIIGAYLFIFYKFSSNMYLSIFLYVTLGMYFSAHNLTSQYIAVALCLYSIKYILDRKLVKFLLISLAAIFIHPSAAFFIPIYFLANINISKKVVVIYAVSTVFLVVFFNTVLHFVQNYWYSNYTQDSFGMVKSNIINIFIPALTLIPSLYGYSNKSRKLQVSQVNITEKLQNNLLTHICIIYFVCLLLAVSKIIVMSRIGHYFNIGLLVLLPCTYEVLDIKKKRIAYCITILIALLNFIVFNLFGQLIPSPYTPFWLFK